MASTRPACPASCSYTAGLSSRTLSELLPCVDALSEGNSDAALDRTALERSQPSEYIDELVRTRDALDRVMARARVHRESGARA